MKLVMKLILMAMMLGCGTVWADTVTVQNGLNGYTGQTNDILNYGGWNYDFTNNVVFPATPGYDQWGLGIWSAHDDIDLVSGAYRFPDGIYHHTQRALLRFAGLESQVPSGQIVTGATLELTCWTYHDDGLGRLMFIRRALQPWTDGDTYWTNYGNGAFDAGYLGSVLCTQSFTLGYGPVQFSIDPNVVQDWVSNPSSNHGMVVMFPYASGISHWTAQGQADANPPKLILTTALEATLSGTIELSDYSGSMGVLAQAQLIQSNTVVRTAEIILRGSNPYSFSIGGITPGTYDVVFKACCWLGKLVPDVVVSGNTDIGGVVLISGDVDGDNEITTSDLATILFNMDQVGDWAPEAPPVTPVLKAHWKLDESSGTTAVDTVGGQNATLTNGPVWQPAGGQFGGSLQFDGVDDYAENAFHLAQPRTAFTIVHWLKPEDMASRSGAAAYYEGGGTDSNYNGFGATNVFEMHTGIANTTPRKWNFFFQDGSTINLTAGDATEGVWTHVAATFDSAGYAILYVNGQPVASAPAGQYLMSNYASVISRIGAVGNLQSNRGWKGQIDDIAVYNYALTQTQIQNVMTNGISP